MVFHNLFAPMDLFGSCDQQAEVAKKFDVLHPGVKLSGGGKEKL